MFYPKAPHQIASSLEFLLHKEEEEHGGRDREHEEEKPQCDGLETFKIMKSVG
jgi:hypothetical protein